MKKQLKRTKQKVIDWLSIKKTSSHWLVTATKAKQRLPKSKVNEKIKRKKK